MTDAEREIVRHSLGLDYPNKCRKGPYRNYYCTHDGDPELESLVAKGMMQRGRTLNEGRDRYYFVTEAGAAAVGSKLPEGD